MYLYLRILYRKTRQKYTKTTFGYFFYFFLPELFVNFQNVWHNQVQRVKHWMFLFYFRGWTECFPEAPGERLSILPDKFPQSLGLFWQRALHSLLWSWSLSDSWRVESDSQPEGDGSTFRSRRHNTPPVLLRQTPSVWISQHNRTRALS